MKKKLIVMLLASLSVHAASVSARTLHFGTSATYAPYEFVDADNKIVGFDIDVANAVCKEMQAECSFTNQSFDSLIPGLRFKKFDAVIAGMDMTPKREQQVSFSQPYYEGLSAVVVTRKGADHTFADLKGKKVGLENGTTHQRYLQDKQQAITPVAYDSYLNAFTDLKNNRLEGVFGDVAAIGKWLKNNPDYAIMDERASDPDYYGKGLGIAVRKGNDALLQEINAALDKVKASPEYAQMQEKWVTQ
ncbi:arginine ABC transporter substrate-binding protein [Salmonella enterica subsp. enterica serovar Bareilly]|nr:arginine ABC transporter substrate-binding protein [Salmonella enterica subsp. enterica serovar Bareilly]EJO0647787.1 arginine ABC transporter substrate-binding protein [Salmonella enterica subsp. enterica serovar Bareilly]